MINFCCNNEQELNLCSSKLVAALQDFLKKKSIEKNFIFLLQGNLGSGKTCFVRSAIRQLLNQPNLKITSPTFTLLEIYEGEANYPILHADLYRLENHTDLLELNLIEYWPNYHCFVEWPEKLEDQFPETYLQIIFEKVMLSKHESRKITLKPKGQFYQDFINWLIIQKN